jgi:hypothetical protein
MYVPNKRSKARRWCVKRDPANGVVRSCGNRGREANIYDGEGSTIFLKSQTRVALLVEPLIPCGHSQGRDLLFGLKPVELTSGWKRMKWR